MVRSDHGAVQVAAGPGELVPLLPRHCLEAAAFDLPVPLLDPVLARDLVPLLHRDLRPEPPVDGDLLRHRHSSDGIKLEIRVIRQFEELVAIVVGDSFSSVANSESSGRCTIVPW